MSDPLVMFSDLELFLTGWFRARLAEWPDPVAHGVTVDRVEREPIQAPLLVVRDDGATDTSVLTADASLGFSILAGTREYPKPAKDLALIVHALLPQIPSGDPDNPFAALLTRTSPVLVAEEQPFARAYVAATFSIAGRGL